MNRADLGPYLVRIQIKDERGNVVGEAEAVSFKGLLAIAHEEGLEETSTEIVQLPTGDNGNMAVVRARVKTKRGSFTGTGDANPGNVNRRIAPHVLRMAETRALARALRIAVNIGEVAVEELMDDAPASDRRGPPQPVVPRPANARRREQGVPVDLDPEDDGRDPPSRSARDDRRHVDRFEQSFRGRDDRPTEATRDDGRAMTDSQRRLLFRLAYETGSKDTALDRVLQALGVERLEWATRAGASRAIESWRSAAKADNGRANGDGRRPENGVGHA